MRRKSSVERREMDAFARYWDSLYEAVPEARRKAAETMGESVKRDLDAQIGKADLESDAKGTVRSWQQIRIGSLGGYAAVSPKAYKWSHQHGKGKPKFWKQMRVSTRMVTKWLERGHGVGHRPSTNSKGSRLARGLREGKSMWNDKTGVNFVYGRMFYSWAKMKAWDHAKDAADKVLGKIADEVDY